MRTQNKLKRIVTVGVLAMGIAGGAHALNLPPLSGKAAKFVQYLEASRDMRDTQGKLSLWERVVYSYILAASDSNRAS
mgnify:CR=1 FL=1